MSLVAFAGPAAPSYAISVPRWFATDVRSTTSTRFCCWLRSLNSWTTTTAASAAVAVVTRSFHRNRKQINGHFVRECQASAVVRQAAASQDSAGNQAILFDCDGVIVVSEELHRIAYNQVFGEYKTGVEWSKEYYDVLMNTIGGGKPKMRYHFNKNGWPKSTLGDCPDTEEAQEALIDALQERKTAIFQELVEAGEAEPRPGIIELIDEALARPDLKAAICSAATKSAAQTVLNSVLGQERLSRFDLLLMGDDVAKKKPDPLIYNLASERLGIPPSKCAVIEDSKIGLDAAVGASMDCYITYTPSTADQDFSRAKEVVADATKLSLDAIFPE